MVGSAGGAKAKHIGGRSITHEKHVDIAAEKGLKPFYRVGSEWIVAVGGNVPGVGGMNGLENKRMDAAVIVTGKPFMDGSVLHAVFL
jgi:hypothetical protein